MLARTIPFLLALVACAANSPEEIAAAQAERDRRVMAERAAMTPEQREKADMDGLAAAGCRARARMVFATYPDYSPGQFYGRAAAQQAHGACMEYYQTTGIVPGG